MMTLKSAILDLIKGKKQPEKKQAIALPQVYDQVYKLLNPINENGDLIASGDNYIWLNDIYRDDNGDLFAVCSNNGHLYTYPIVFDASNNAVSLGVQSEVQPVFLPVKAARARIIRQADGSYRWLRVVATSLLNRCGEIDAHDLFDDMVERAQVSGHYPYRTFFHLGQVLRLGQADYLARDGYTYIESGVFDKADPDTLIGKLIAATIRALQDHPDEWGDSIGYMPIGEPEQWQVADGISIPVYHRGIHLETSTLPETDAANWFTAGILRKDKIMEKRIRDALVKLFPGQDAIVDEFEQLVDGVNTTVESERMIARADQTEPAPTAPVAEVEAPGSETQAPLPEAEPAADPFDAFMAKIDMAFTNTSAQITEMSESIAGLQTMLAKSLEPSAKVQALEKQVDALVKWQSAFVKDLPAREPAQVTTYRPRGQATETKPMTMSEKAAAILNRDPVAK
jgi:hypothetical protein